MSTYSLSHLADHVLLRDLAALVAKDRITTAALLAHVAEVDARRLYVSAGFPSMYAYCVSQLRLSEDAAYKRIQAARTARQFPALFSALADGRLNLTGVLLLGPHLTPGNADDLLGAAAGKSKAEIELLLAERFPRPELLAMVEALPAAEPPDRQLAPERVAVGDVKDRAAPNPVAGEALAVQLAPERVAAPVSRCVVPLARERFALHVPIGKSTHDKLTYAQELLSHAVPAGDIAQVLDRALDALIAKLERRKFAATAKPRPRQQATSNSRYVPAHVRHAVWERDGGRCTFVGQTGHRCGSRKFLELDHIEPVARGSQATVEGMRLLCRAHNQYEAERAFGVGFMNEKREWARRAAAHTRARGAAAAAQAQVSAAAQARAAVHEQAEDVMAGLRELGVPADRARRAAEFCQTLPNATLEDRMRAALKFICPKRAIRPESLS